MNGSATTKALERAIFERFALAAGFDVEGASIAQPDPPDIVCNIRGLGSVAFEPAAPSAGDVRRRALVGQNKCETKIIMGNSR
jgi:hypothetical protein